MKFSAAALLSLASAAFAAPTLQAREAPSGVTIGKVVYGGSGCPQNSLKPQVSPDGTQIFVNYNNKLFTAGNDERKNCQINLTLNYPSGWTYAVASTHTLGKVNLSSGSVGYFDISYYTSGEQNDVGSSFVFKGPINKDFTAVDTIGVLRYAGCDSSSEGLNINSVVRVDGKGSITLDAAATAFAVNLNWKTC